MPGKFLCPNFLFPCLFQRNRHVLPDSAQASHNGHTAVLTPAADTPRFALAWTLDRLSFLQQWPCTIHRWIPWSGALVNLLDPSLRAYVL